MKKAFKERILTCEMGENPANNTEKTLEDMARILEISQALAATSDRDELLEQIIEFSLDLLGVERATLFLYDKESHELVANIATGMQELRVPADKGFCGECIKTGGTLVIPDAYADPRFNPEVDRESGFHTRNIMSIPLNGYDGDLVGVLQLLNRKDGAFRDYDITLAETLGAQAGVVIQKANLIEHLLEKQKMQRAMQIAREIQQRLLPDKPPEIQGFDVGGLTDPADETGGDIFDFIEMPDGGWAFAVADATGHGIGPALIISETRAMIRASAHLGRSDEPAVGNIMATVNDLLCHDLDGSSFVTCFLGILDSEQNLLTYVSAGHGPLIFYRRGPDRFTQESANGLPLGVMQETRFDKAGTFTFDRGDMVIITTDGIFEAENGNSEQFGIRRMLEIIRARRDYPAAEIISELRSQVAQFAAPPQADDITAIVIKRK